MKKVFPDDFFYQLTYTQNIFWVYTHYSSDLQPLLAHTWTLAIEEQFYLIWPFMIWIIPNKYLAKLCAAMVLFGVFFRIASVLYSNNQYITSILLFSQIDALALGGLLACYKTNLTRGILFDFLLRKAFLIGLIGMGSIIIFISSKNGVSLYSAYDSFRTSAGYINNVFTAQIFLFLALFSVGLTYYCIDNKSTLLKEVLSNKYLKHLGKISYGLYLYHWPIITVLKKMIPNNYVLSITALSLTYLVSVVSFYTIEKYFNDMKWRFSYK